MQSYIAGFLLIVALSQMLSVVDCDREQEEEQAPAFYFNPLSGRVFRSHGKNMSNIKRDRTAMAPADGEMRPDQKRFNMGALVGLLRSIEKSGKNRPPAGPSRVGLETIAHKVPPTF